MLLSLQGLRKLPKISKVSVSIAPKRNFSNFAELFENLKREQSSGEGNASKEGYQRTGFQRREDFPPSGGFQRREGGFQRRDDSQSGGFQRRDDSQSGFQRRDDSQSGGFQRRDGGFQRGGSFQRRMDSGGNFQRRDGDFSGGGNFLRRGGERRPPRMEADEELVDPFSFESESTKTTIDFSKYEVPVDIKGTNIPPPVESFQALKLDPSVLRNLEREDIKELFPIQKHGLAIAFNGRDMIGCAQTGSGKTLAYLLPAIQQAIDAKKSGEDFGQPKALIVCPTRELAQQIAKETYKFISGTGLRATAVFGGSSQTPQLASINEGVDILIGTPGRINDFLNTGMLGLNKVKYVVLDEADRMLDMGFMPQIQSIFQQTPPKTERQTLLFSATFQSDVLNLTRNIVKNDNIFVSVGRVGAAAELVEQHFVYVNQPFEKRERLVNLIDSVDGQTLIFVGRKSFADMITEMLIKRGLTAESIHGDKSQSQRNRALHNFNKKASQFLVATDVAARGLDLPHVNHVINFDLPSSVDSYIHRIGRTGRAGKKGRASSLVSSQDPSFTVRDIVSTLREAKKEVPQWLQDLAVGGNQGFGRKGYTPRRY